MSPQIHTVSLSEYRPVVLHGEFVYQRHRALTSVLASLLGEEYAKLLAKPGEFTEEEASWILPSGPRAVPMPALAEHRRQALLEKLRGRVTDILQLCERLQQSDDADRRTLGKLLERALEIPGNECIYAVGNEPCLVCWGFHRDKMQAGGDFRLVRYVLPDGPAGAPALAPSAASAGGTPADWARVSPAAPAAPQGTHRRPWQRWAAALLLLLGLGALAWWWLASAREPQAPALAAQEQEEAAPAPAPAPEPLTETLEGVSRQRLPGSLVVSLRAGYSSQALKEALRRQGLAEGLRFVFADDALGVVHLRCDEAQYARLRQALAGIPGVTGVSGEYRQATQQSGAAVPGDPAFSSSDVRQAWALREIRAPQAWALHEGSAVTLIAVVDSGFDAQHPEFAGKRLSTWNVATGSPRLDGDAESMRHGTHVAALAAGNKDNHAGAAGSCPRCALLLIQAADRRGHITTLSLVHAIAHAAQAGAAVLNLSIGSALRLDGTRFNAAMVQAFIDGTRDEERLWAQVFRRAAEAGVIVVQAAGNEGIPAVLDPMKRDAGTLVVGASQASGAPAAFSNFGSAVPVSAPGQQVYSALPGNQYGWLDGTSMASPLVAGAVALLRSRHPQRSFPEIRSALIQSGKPVGAGSTRRVGPIVQLDRALQLLAATPEADFDVPPQASAASPNRGAEDDRNACAADAAQLKAEVGALKAELARLRRAGAS